MPPTSSINVVEIALKLGQETEQMKTTAKLIEETAQEMATGVVKSMKTAGEAFGKFVDDSKVTLNNWQTDLDTAFMSTLEGLGFWLKNLFTEQISPVTKGMRIGLLSANLAAQGLLATLVRTIRFAGGLAEATISTGETMVKWFVETKIKILAVWKVLMDTKDLIWENVKAAGAFIGKWTGISYALEKAQKFATFSLKVVGVTSALSVIKSFFTGASHAGGGFLSAFDVLADHINAALQPLANVLTDLAIDIAPTIVEILVPLIKFLIEGVNYISRAFGDMVTSSGTFQNILLVFQNVVGSIGETFFKIVKALVETVVPAIAPVIESLAKFLLQAVNMLMPALMRIINALMPIVKTLLNVLTEVFARVFDPSVIKAFQVILEAVEKGIMMVVDSLSSALKDIVPLLGSALKALGEFLVALGPVIALVVKVIALVASKLFLPIIIGGLKVVLVLITSIAKFLAENMGAALRQFAGTFTWVFERIITPVGNMFTWLGNKVTAVIKVLINTLSWAWNFFKTFLFGKDTTGGKIEGIIGNIFSFATKSYEWIQSIVRGLIKAVNSVLSFKLPVVGSLGARLGIKPIPVPLQEGGIVVRPTLATIGEAGPEAVIPLKKEILQKVIPVQIKPIPVKFPDTMKVAHGSASLELLTKLVDQAKKIDEYIRWELSEERMSDKSIEPSFGRGGFSV